MKQILACTLLSVLLSGTIAAYGQDAGKSKSAYVTDATPPAGVKMKVRRNLDEATFQAGAAFVVFTGGNNAPFATGLGVNFGMINPQPKKHYAIEYVLDLDYCTSPSKNWNARSVGTTPSNISSMSAGYNMDLGMVLSAIIINQHKLAVIVGPEVMFQSMYLSALKLKVGDARFRDRMLISFAPGIKASAYIGEKLIANIEYSACLKSSVSYDDYTAYSTAIKTPVSLQLLRVGVGFRF